MSYDTYELHSVSFKLRELAQQIGTVAIPDDPKVNLSKAEAEKLRQLRRLQDVIGMQADALQDSMLLLEAMQRQIGGAA